MASTPVKDSTVSKKSKPRKKKSEPTAELLLPTTVLQAVESEVNKLPASLRGSALAITALHLAKILSETSAARDSAALARELRAVLTDLAVAVATAGDKNDRVDELQERRKLRRSNVGV